MFALIQAPEGFQASRFGISMEEIVPKNRNGTPIAYMSAVVNNFRFVSSKYATDGSCNLKPLHLNP